MKLVRHRIIYMITKQCKNILQKILIVIIRLLGKGKKIKYAKLSILSGTWSIYISKSLLTFK